MQLVPRRQFGPRYSLGLERSASKGEEYFEKENRRIESKTASSGPTPCRPVLDHPPIYPPSTPAYPDIYPSLVQPSLPTRLPSLPPLLTHTPTYQHNISALPPLPPRCLRRREGSPSGATCGTIDVIHLSSESTNSCLTIHLSHLNWSLCLN
ncbi:hypothetical protein E2C01_059528 [Portunus trituberculatus]|uniref:Uncharacterized protein n=1 Tax=Portunus trituberculatus TaxID=210409 RepID=A0A5B7H9A9_PORTR|nr:hypothetical protein [Portunus trituberculatus]